MNRILAILFPVVVLLSVQVQGEESSHFEGRIEAFTEESHPVWIGLFSHPPSEASQAFSWTSVDTERFQLSTPQEFDEVFLLALQKDSVPLMKRISSSHFDNEVVLDFATGQSLRGTVLSEDEFSIPDAELSVSCNELFSITIPEEAKSTWKSDSEGKFAISGLATGECKVNVVARPEMPKETFDVLIESNVIVRDFTLTDVRFVSGQVVDHKGGVVSDAEVTANIYFGGWFETTTDKEGTFSFGPFLSGTSINLFARHATNGSTQNSKVLAGKHDILLKLSPLTRVVGMVVDAKTGDPIEEFVLNARRQHSGAKFPHKETEGRISAMVDSNSHSFAVEAPGYVYHWEDAVVFAGIEYDLGTVELEAGKTLTGKVYDASTGLPIKGADLFLFKDFGDNPSTSRVLRLRYFQDAVSATTSVEGAFSLGPLPFEDAELFITVARYVLVDTDGHSLPRVAVSALAESIDIPMNVWQPRSTRIRGIVQTNFGEPVKGTVQIDTDAGGAGHGNNEDGTFDRGVYPGSFEVYARTKFGLTNTVKVSLQEGETVDLVLTVDRRGMLSGVIEGLQAGEEVTLNIVNQRSLHTRFGNVWGNGAFQVEGVPAGKYSVTATSDIGREIEESFEIQEENGEAYVELIFPGASRLFGSVEGAESSSYEIRVVAAPRASSATKGWSEVYDDGTYEIHGLENGNYSVAAYRSSSRFEEFDSQLGPSTKVVIQGDTRLDIPLVAGTFSVSGVIHPVDEAAGATVFLGFPGVQKFFSATANNHGQFRFGGLRAGRYSLAVSVDGFVHHSEALQVGSSIENHQVTLEPKPLGPYHVSGTVHPTSKTAGTFITIARRSDGAPIKSVQVGEKGEFVLDQLAPDTYVLQLFIEELGLLQKEVSLDSSIEGLNISFDSKEQ